MRVEILNKKHEIQTVIIHLETGEEVPLHDHPNTHVFLFVLKGTLQMDCYDFVSRTEEGLWITPNFSKEFVSQDYLLVEPQQNNLHHIKALKPSAFMDVVTPGYFEAHNEPTWYEIVEMQQPHFKIKTIPQPEDLMQAKLDALERFNQALGVE